MSKRVCNQNYNQNSSSIQRRLEFLVPH